MTRCFSAGVGRTGTFIAIDYLLEQAQTEGQINVFGAVQTLRNQRVCMVQTEVRRGLGATPRDGTCPEPTVSTLWELCSQINW